jgi:predicted nucleic acid-binding protein
LKAFLDTSVLVATFYGEHQNHTASLDLFVSLGKKTGAVAAHSLAEVYSSLTRMPGKDRVSGEHAVLFLGSIGERMQIVSLEGDEYFRAIEAFATQALTGGAIYDGLIAHCALKVRAEVIYTWNVKDFKRLGPEISVRVQTPESR